MENITAQEIENIAIQISVRKALQQEKIPKEEEIRKIVAEEIENYYKKEEEEKKRPLSERFSEIFKRKNLPHLIGYIIMFALAFLCVGSFAILTNIGKDILPPDPVVNVYTILITLLFIAIATLLVFGMMELYDYMISKDCKHAKLICLLEILYWCNVLLPEASTWFEHLF